MVAFGMIILISFVILAIILSAMIQSYNEQMTRDDLSQAANSVSDIIESELADSTTDIYDHVLNNYSSVQADISALTRHISELHVLITDTNGRRVISNEGATETYFHGNLSPEIASSIIDGGERSFEGDLGGILDGKHYIFAQPIGSKSGEAEGIVIACLSADYAVSYVTRTIQTIMMVSMWVMIAAIIASYFISEKIAKPLREMSKAAKEFAAGHFDVRVPVTGNDEISALAVAFNNMAADLETLEQTRRTFLANVSHDLRTPMTAIGGFVDGMLAGAIPPDKYEHYLGIIGNEVRRLARLVNALLDLSRIQAGERKFSMAPFDICELARQTLFSFEQKIDDKKLEVEFDFDEDNMIAIADKDAINQIVYNIVDNAIKFSKEGGLLKIGSHVKDKKIHFSVYNEGIGIPPEDLPFVFERFYKADKSRGMDKTGVGLGMFIARTIIEAHGETISVSSVQNEYCRFEFTLKRDASRTGIHEHKRIPQTDHRA